MARHRWRKIYQNDERTFEYVDPKTKKEWEENWVSGTTEYKYECVKCGDIKQFKSEYGNYYHFPENIFQELENTKYFDKETKQERQKAGECKGVIDGNKK